jgi:nucleoid-associated protein EbfC
MNLQDLMKAAASMQTKMQDAQASLEKISVTGVSGAGLVSAMVNGKGKLTRLTIDPSLFKPEDREVVEDLIVAAVADGQRKAEAAAAEEMAKVTKGLPIPDGMKLPF